MLAWTARRPSSVKAMGCAPVTAGQMSGNARLDASLYMKVMAVLWVNSGMPPVKVQVSRPAGRYAGSVGGSAVPLK